MAGRRQLQIVCQRQYVVHSTVARADGNLMAFDDAVQIVFEKLRVEPSRELDGAECGRGVRKPAAGKFVAQEGIVEFAVVRQQERAAQPMQQIVRQVGKRRRIGHHFIVDAGQVADEFGDVPLGVHQLAVA